MSDELRRGRVLTGWRALFAATLLWAMTVGGLPQYILGVLAPFITADLGLSRTQLGALSTGYFVVGAIVSPFSGQLVDRVGGRRALLLTFWLGVVGIAGMGVAPGYLLLMLAVCVGGVSLSLMNPATNHLVAVHLPRGQQGVVMGLKQSGVQVGAVLAGAVLPAAALALGWRTATALLGVTGLLGLLGTRLWVPRPERDTPAAGTARRPRQPVGSFVRWLTGYAFLMGAGVAAVLAFVVLYAVEELGLSEGRAGIVAAVIGGVSVAARILWGRAAEQLRTSTAPLLALAVGSVLAQVLVWGAAAAGEWLLWLGAAVFGATAAAWNAVGMFAVVREVDAASTGRASGIVQSGFYAGLLICPILFGASVDATGGYDLGWAGVTGVFLAATALAVRWHTRRR